MRLGHDLVMPGFWEPDHRAHRSYYCSSLRWPTLMVWRGVALRQGSSLFNAVASCLHEFSSGACAPERGCMVIVPQIYSAFLYKERTKAWQEWQRSQQAYSRTLLPGGYPEWWKTHHLCICAFLGVETLPLKTSMWLSNLSQIKLELGRSCNHDLLKQIINRISVTCKEWRIGYWEQKAKFSTNLWWFPFIYWMRYIYFSASHQRPLISVSNFFKNSL